MATKDADLARDFSQDFVYINNDGVAAFEVSLETTPKQVDQVGGDRTEELFLVEVAVAAFELSITDAPHEIAPPPVIPDTTPPTASNFVPALGIGIEANQVIQFDLTDETGFAAAMVHVSFADGTIDLVHDNNGFRGHYVGGSNSRAAISGGFRYTVLRIGGWPSSPTFEFFPVDTSGNVGVIA